jgi:hypothetical protein
MELDNSDVDLGGKGDLEFNVGSKPRMVAR